MRDERAEQKVEKIHFREDRQIDRECGKRGNKERK